MAGVLAKSTAIVFGTTFRHILEYLGKKKSYDSKAREKILYDEASLMGLRVIKDITAKALSSVLFMRILGMTSGAI